MTLDAQALGLIANGSESERLQLLLAALTLQSPVVADFISTVVNPARLEFRIVLETAGMSL